MSTPNFRNAALELAAKGFRVFPIPVLRKAANLEQWNKKASTSTEWVETIWYDADCNENIGLATGGGVFVLDEDPRNGSDTSITDLVLMNDALPGTLSVRTPSGGRHRYFRAPQGLRIPNSTGKLGAGLDIRGDGGYVVAPPSVLDTRPHQTAGAYAFENALPIADAPEWLLEMIAAPSAGAASTGPIAETVEVAELRKLLKTKDPNMNYDDWTRVGMALHHATRGAAEGLQLWDEWSQGATRKDDRGNPVYQGVHTLAPHWASFSSEPGKHVVTVGSLKKGQVADAEDFEIIEPEGERDDGPVPTVGGIPSAHHLCTDLANANRLRRVYGKKLIVVNGEFYAWSGTHWENDSGEAARCAAKLSAIVKGEAKQAREKYDALAVKSPKEHEAISTAHRIDQSKVAKKAIATPEGAALLKALTIADALDKWSKQCEMVNTQKAALTQLRDMLTFDAARLDCNRNLLNCQNGTVDLRTGELLPHNPLDYITICLSTRYDANAPAPRFEKFMSEVMDGEEIMVDFMRRWYGYCATGETREQKLLVQIGDGGGGKGTSVNAIDSVLGEYAAPAASGLLTASKSDDRHPVEIADLQGKRLVTASESDHGAELREGFVKWITGADPLKARWMYGNPFTFLPTHKIQLLTNHKPTIKDQGFGMWRRILLVWFKVKFGDADMVAAGKAHYLADMSLPDALREEREGILAWVVRGAVEWYRDGLQPPSSVVMAGRQYQRDQDRTAQFVAERCILDPNKWSPFDRTLDADIDATDGLYPHYATWCKDSGYHALGKAKFSQELERVVPGFRRVERKTNKDGVRRSTYGCYGIYVDPSGVGGVFEKTESEAPQTTEDPLLC